MNKIIASDRPIVFKDKKQTKVDYGKTIGANLANRPEIIIGGALGIYGIYLLSNWVTEWLKRAYNAFPHISEEDALALVIGGPAGLGVFKAMKDKGGDTTVRPFDPIWWLS